MGSRSAQLDGIIMLYIELSGILWDASWHTGEK